MLMLILASYYQHVCTCGSKELGEIINLPLLCLWMTCNPLSILPSRQTCGQAFAVVVAVGADAVHAFSLLSIMLIWNGKYKVVFR